MPAYRYRGIATDGRNVSGSVEADSGRGARTALREMGVFASDVSEMSEASANPLQLGTRQRVSAAELSRLLRQMAVLLRAGIPLTECVASLVRQHSGNFLADALRGIRARINEGTSLAAAMAEQPQTFPPMYVSMVAAGEAGGALETVLDRCADHAEASANLNRRVRAAMTYPAVMFVVGGGIVLFLLAYVVPQVTRVFVEAKQTLPLPTRLLMGAGSFLGNWGLLVVLAIAGGVAALRSWAARPQGRKRFETFVLSVPWIGTLAKRIAVARFAQTLSTMVAGGLPLIDALRIARAATGSVVLEEELVLAEEAVLRGESLAAHLDASELFDPMVIDMMAVGERSGDLQGMLGRASEALDDQVRDRIDLAASLLEPIMILVMAGMVLFVVLAIMLPVFEMNQLVR
jgi:general secretion pathway protein F